MSPEVTSYPCASDWRAWLEENHSGSEGVWLRIAKKGSTDPSPTYAQALDEALCYGWIDGQKKPLDEHGWLQRFVPRRAKSNWSKINCGHAERLIREGKMREAGVRQIQRAKEDGRWDSAYDSPSNIQVPDDLAEALSKSPAGQEMFNKLNRTNRYAILYRVQIAKKPETRMKRIQQFIEMLERGETIHPQ